MHIQRTKVRSGKSFKRYARLVQSYRRDDGMPAQKVIANLGELSDQEYDNLKAALAASRKGRALVLPAPTTGALKTRIQANLDYLGLAVMYEIWRGWRLSELLGRVIDESSALVSPAKILCALTLQRCVAPGSKLSAQSWFPRTALPELLDIEPAHFNNSRLHRVLEQLDRADLALQEALPKRYQHKDGAFAALFVDVSDAWFEGRGCDLAERNRTKEGLRNRYKVGILLLCNERGYPLRWKVLPGKTRDPQVLSELVGEIEDVGWARDIPITFDRAMGTASAVARLVHSGLKFLTATRRSEIASYTDGLPSTALSDLQGSEDEQEQERIKAEAAKKVVEAGMEKVDEHLYVLDLGMCERQLPSPGAKAADGELHVEVEALEGGASWLWQARQYRQQIEDKVFGTRAELAASLGVSRARVTQIMNLLRLDEGLQRDVLTGRFGFISERKLRSIAVLGTKSAQRRALEEHATTARPMGGSDAPRRPRRLGKVDARLRLVAYFNPQMFADQRATARRHLERVEAHVADLNRRLRRNRTGRTRHSVHAQIVNKLASLSLLSVYDVQIVEVAPAEAQEPHFEVRLRLDAEAWQKRRRFDGFVLLVAHPELAGTAAELVQLYRAKDAVEKDFQTIKSDLKLRPVFHYTDPKVRAHVTICMLALLLERTLEDQLRRSKHPMTAQACLEELAPAHLNMLETDPDLPRNYVVTKATPRQHTILRTLRMSKLVDANYVAEALHPRAPE